MSDSTASTPAGTTSTPAAPAEPSAGAPSGGAERPPAG
ncbi:ComEA family DNA-binding protein, partial [Actinomadura logoneensis]